MAYADTNHAVVTAAAATGLAKWNALRDFFNGGGSTKWSLANPADPSGSGLWLVGPDDTQAIVIRRDTAGSTWYVTSAVDGTVSSPGNATNPATLSYFGGADADAVVERQHIPDTGYTKMLVIEFADAIAILEYGNASENTYPKGIHAGLTLVAVDPSWVDSGLARGNAVHVGSPTLNAISASQALWFSSGGVVATNAQQARCFGEPWWPCGMELDSAQVINDNAAGETMAAPIPVLLVAQTSSRRLGGFVTKYLRFVSADAAGAGPAGTRYEIGTQGWVRVSPTNTTSARMCISCEQGKAVR